MYVSEISNDDFSSIRLVEQTFFFGPQSKQDPKPRDLFFLTSSGTKLILNF